MCILIIIPFGCGGKGQALLVFQRWHFDLQRLRHVPESKWTVCVWSLNLIRNYNYNQSAFFPQYYQSRLFLYD